MLKPLNNNKLIEHNGKKVDIFYIFISYYFTKTPKMKKNYFLTLILTLCFGMLSYGQGTETFANSNATTSYADNSFVGQDGVTWTYVASRDANADANNSGISLPALMLRRVSSGSKITSSAISGGIGDFSVKLYKGFTGGGDRQVELFINGVSQGTSTPFDDFSEHVFSVSGINVTGDIVIEIVNITSKQVIIDDITWTAASSDPSISITAPANNTVYPSTTTEVPVTLNVSNFTLSGDNGAGMTDNSGDGYIKATLQETGEADEITSFFTTTPTPITVVPGRSYTATVELVDNAGASLSPQAMASVSFSVEYPCDLTLGTITTTCDALTSGTDTFTGSIAFTGGNTGVTYTITAPAGVTVGGDDPDTAATGTITFSGMTEGMDYDINITGGSGSSCDHDRTLYSPSCIAFPIVDTFNYTAGSNLTDSSDWFEAFSGDDIAVVASTMGNPYGPTEFPEPTGNMLSFDGSGKEAYRFFNDTGSGKIFASFLFTVTDISMQQASGGYFVILAEPGGSYRTRLWLKPNAGDNTKYEVGLSVGSSSASVVYDGILHEPGEEIFAVVSYDFSNDTASLWIDPDPATFNTANPPVATATQVATANDIPSNLGRFYLRQDDADETPAINFDELRISTNWAEVAPTAASASTKDNTIDGFSAYPNPVNNKRFTITTSSISEKNVKIFNVLGRQVFATKFSSNNKLVDISSLSTGVYILKVQEGSKIATKKLVVR